jgi:acyl-CoA thioesterase-1
MPLRRLVMFALLLVVSACSLRDAACGTPAPSGSQEAVLPTAITGGAAETPSSDTFHIAFLGDSLTAGLGLLAQQAYPGTIEEMFRAEGYTSVEVINGGMSGDTTAGGLRRVGQLLLPSVRILVVALGANDALRGLTVSQTRENLRQIIDIAQARDVYVMLCGMEAPTNLGEDYRSAFKQVYFDLLRAYQRQIVYVPFLLEGVAGRPELNQADGVHPNADGARVIATALFPQLRNMVDRQGGGGD